MPLAVRFCYYAILRSFQALTRLNVVYFALKSTPLSPTSYPTILCQHGGHDPPCHMLQYNSFHHNIYLSLLAAHACPVALILAPIIVICGGVAKLANHSPTQSYYVTVDTLFVAVSYWALYCGTVS